MYACLLLLSALIKKLNHTNPLDLIIIDDLQLLRLEAHKTSLRNDRTEITTNLKQLATEFNTIQLNGSISDFSSLVRYFCSSSKSLFICSNLIFIRSDGTSFQRNTMSVFHRSDRLSLCKNTKKDFFR